MIDKDRWTRWRSKVRAAAAVLSIFVILVIAILSLRSRDLRAISPSEFSTRMLAASPPVERPANSPPTGNNGSTTVEVCGYGKLPIDEKDPGAIFRKIAELTKGAAMRWLSALQNSDDLRARMAGLLLEGKVTGGELRPATAQSRDEAVQLAAGAEDPAVYAMALLMCAGPAAPDADGACRRLSLQRWAQMDPDNAAPWLLLAGEARARRDSAAEADAFSHAATAHKIDSYSGSVLAFAEPEVPHDATPLDRLYLAIQAIGVETAAPLSRYDSVALHHCPADAMPDDTVRRQCDSLAELLVTKSSSLIDLGVGASIGARAGWRAERVQKLMLEQHALMQAIMSQSAADEGKPWTCDAVSRVDAYLRQRVHLGEIGAAQEVLDRSGESVESMAEKYSQNIDNIQREAARREQENSQRPPSD